MALTLSKSNCSGVSPPDSESAAGRNIDEALWTAYHRHDKSAVTENLLRRLSFENPSATNRSQDVTTVATSARTLKESLTPGRKSLASKRVDQSDARTHRTPKAVRPKFIKDPLSGFASAFGVRARPCVALRTAAAFREHQRFALR
jgi:hypothetical protein